MGAVQHSATQISYLFWQCYGIISEGGDDLLGKSAFGGFKEGDELKIEVNKGKKRIVVRGK